MVKADIICKETIKKILEDGFLDENPRPHYKDGTPAHTLSVNQIVQTFDVSKDEFPLITLRPITWKNSIKEILWIYQDQTSSLDVLENKYNIHWWNEWESKDIPGTIGQRYGATVNKYNLVNNLINDLKNDPFGRRHLMSLWQEQDFLETDGLKPCAFLTMWNVRKKNDEMYLDMTLVQRSSDYLTACAINQLQYISLLMMISRTCNMKPGNFMHVIQNCQIYDRHIENAKIMLNRNSYECSPKLILDTEKTDFFDFTLDDFKLIDYPMDKIKEQNPQLIFELGI